MNRTPKNMPGTQMPCVPFELTATERAWAERLFMACRRMDVAYRSDMLSTVADMAATLAVEHPLHTAPVLRLLKGGAK